jgi:hypothetical protein
MKVGITYLLELAELMCLFAKMIDAFVTYFVEQISREIRLNVSIRRHA